MDAAKIVIRNLEPSDVNFIYASMLRGLYYGNVFYKQIDKTAFFDNYNKHLTSILAKPTNIARIACLEDTPDIIVGYAIYTPLQALHFVYVKDGWRRQGIASKLVPEGLNSVSQVTDLGNTIRRKKKMKFNPWL